MATVNVMLPEKSEPVNAVSKAASVIVQVEPARYADPLAVLPIFSRLPRPSVSISIIRPAPFVQLILAPSVKGILSMSTWE